MPLPAPMLSVMVKKCFSLLGTQLRCGLLVGKREKNALQNPDAVGRGCSFFTRVPRIQVYFKSVFSRLTKSPRYFVNLVINKSCYDIPIWTV